MLLGRERARAPRVGEQVTFGDAHARLVRAEVVAPQVLHGMRGDDRQAGLAREVHRRCDERLVVRPRGALHLEVVAAGKERGPLARVLLRTRRVALQQRLTDVAVPRAGERDQSVRAFLEPASRQFGVAPVLVGPVRARQPLAQTQVAAAIGAEQQQSERRVALGLVRDPDVAADDGLDAALARRPVELDQSEDVAEVGERERGHRVPRRGVDRVVDAHGAVGDRVLAVQPQVDEGGIAHGTRRAAHPATPQRVADGFCISLLEFYPRASARERRAREKRSCIAPSCYAAPWPCSGSRSRRARPRPKHRCRHRAAPAAPAPKPTAPPLPRTAEPPPPPVNLEGFPLPYRQGFADGCASAGGVERKDVTRFAAGGNYRTGWQDGLAQCRRGK